MQVHAIRNSLSTSHYTVGSPSNPLLCTIQCRLHKLLVECPIEYVIIRMYVHTYMCIIKMFYHFLVSGLPSSCSVAVVVFVLLFYHLSHSLARYVVVAILVTYVMMIVDWSFVSSERFLDSRGAVLHTWIVHTPG
jgi:hypothetical protein